MAELFGRGARAIGLVKKLHYGMKTSPCSIAWLSRQICSCKRNNLPSVSDKLLSSTRTLRRNFPSINCQQASSSSKAANKKTGPISWQGFLAFAAVGGAFIYYVKYLKEEKERMKEAEKTRSIGMASLGGPFQLIDQDGKTTTDKDFHGQWVLIYFGFCHCPDICPDQLEKMTTVIETLDGTKGLPTIQPLYITVDPTRDDPACIKEYLKDFHPRFIGLTGTEAQVKAVTKAYRVYFSAGPMDEDKDYIVDHTIIQYLVSPEGKFVEYFGQNKTIDEIVSSIGTRMMSYKHGK
eukprot:Seg765.2 transcript_id=Seg765.2/GoldUCD/mRNA.D3Y31 product="Protein SCO1-like mitochondrial" protein_id=Seg765.2/GoldUCD/D3Y31